MKNNFKESLNKIDIPAGRKDAILEGILSAADNIRRGKRKENNVMKNIWRFALAGVGLAVCIAFAVIAVTALSARPEAPLASRAPLASGAQQEVQYPPSASQIPCFMPIYFDSEEQLLSTIDQVKSKKGAADSIVIIDAKMTGKQTYSAKSDDFKLASISEFYKPKDILNGLFFNEIIVNNYYVMFDYVNEYGVVCGTFSWFREISPEVHMNGFDGREIEYNGVKYVFQEWTDHESSGFSANWIAAGRAYSAFARGDYSDDEMLAFCQFEAVPAE